jgi:hypothetical protein
MLQGAPVLAKPFIERKLLEAVLQVLHNACIAPPADAVSAQPHAE